MALVSWGAVGPDAGSAFGRSLAVAPLATDCPASAVGSAFGRFDAAPPFGSRFAGAGGPDAGSAFGRFDAAPPSGSRFAVAGGLDALSAFGRFDVVSAFRSSSRFKDPRASDAGCAFGSGFGFGS